MPLFICDNCGARDNTATGWYWSRNKTGEYFGEGYKDGQALCASCTPAYTLSTLKAAESGEKPLKSEGILGGAIEERDGKMFHQWHNSFDFKIPDREEVLELIYGDHIMETNRLVEVLGSKQAVKEAFKECDRRKEVKRQEYIAEEKRKAAQHANSGGGQSVSVLGANPPRLTPRESKIDLKYIGRRKKHKVGPGKRGRP